MLALVNILRVISSSGSELILSYINRILDSPNFTLTTEPNDLVSVTEY